MRYNRLKEVLDEEGITQKQLSFLCGLSVSTINKICNNSIGRVGRATEAQIIGAINREVGQPKYKGEDVF